MIRSYQKETIFAQGDVTPSCHASTVLPLADGTVLAAWFGGQHEKADDVNIYCAKRGKTGGWSSPARVSEDDGVPNWNPVLFERANGEIVLFYKYGKEIPFWITKYCVSADGGETWTKPAELVPGDTSGGRGPVKNKCLRLASGVVLAPASTEQGRWLPFIDVSNDDGRTWTADPPMERAKYKGAYVGLIQPTLWESEPGQVHALMRSDKCALYRSDSADGGLTWTKPKRTRLPNNNSGVDLAKDGQGRLWLLYNPVDVDWGVRHPLSLSVSLDNGYHFTEILRPEPGNGEFSYPSIVYRDGMLHAVYTNRRKQINYLAITLED